MGIERGDQLTLDELFAAIADKMFLEDVPQAIDWSTPLAVEELAKEPHLLVNHRLTLARKKLRKR